MTNEPRRRTETSQYKKGRRLTDALFITPAIVGFAVVILIPFLLGIYYSFTDWDGLKINLHTVGWANYVSIFTDIKFLHSFLATAEYALINVFLVNFVAFCLALLVTGAARGKNIYRAGFFVPNLIGGIVLGTIWQFIFSNIIPSFANTLGIPGLQISLLAKGSTIIWVMSVVNTWQYWSRPQGLYQAES